MVIWLVKALGLKGITKWGMRLILWAAVLVTLLIVIAVLVASEEARKVAFVLVALAIVFPFVRALLSRQKGQADAGERTIDGKVVPDKLAVAALDIPPQSPDGEYVLRGLPDYGKVLLKLNTADFAYVPESSTRVPPPPPIEKLAVSRAWLAGVPRWSIAAGVAALLVVAGVGISQAPWGASANVAPAPRAPIVNAFEQAPLPTQTTNSEGAQAQAAANGNSSQQEPDLKTLRTSGYYHVGVALEAMKAQKPATEEMEQGIAAFGSAAQRGDAESEYFLALLYLNLMPDLKIPSDYEAGKNFLMKAAVQRYTSAELVLAACTEKPCEGFERNMADALEWYRKVVVDAPEGSDKRIEAQKALDRIGGIAAH